MLVKPKWLLTRDLKYVDVSTLAEQSMGYYKFDVEVPGLASTMDNFQLRLDTCNNIVLMTPKEQEAYYRVVDVLVKKLGSITASVTFSATHKPRVQTKTKTKTKTKHKTKTTVTSKKPHVMVSKSKVVKMAGIRRNWGRKRTVPKVKHDGYKIKPDDHIKVVQVRTRLGLVDPKLLKALTVKVNDKKIDLHKVITDKQYTAVLSDLVGADTLKVYNGNKVIRATNPVKCKRTSAILHLLSWLSNKHKDAWLISSTAAAAKLKLLEKKKSATAWSWSRSHLNSQITQQKKTLEAIKQLEAGMKDKKTKECLIICLSGLEWYYTSTDSKGLETVAQAFAAFNWKLNAPKYQKQVQEELKKRLASTDLGDLAKLSKGDITRAQTFDLLTLLPELADIADTDLFQIYFKRKTPNQLATAQRRLYNRGYNPGKKTDSQKAKEKQIEELAKRLRSIRAIMPVGYIQGKDIDAMKKAKPLSPAELKQFVKQFKEWDTKLKVTKTKFRSECMKVIATYVLRLAKESKSQTFVEDLLVKMLGPSRQARWKKATATEKKRMLANEFTLDRFFTKAMNLVRSAMVQKVKDQIKDAPAKDKAKVILEMDNKRASLLTASELHELSQDDIRSLVKSNKGYDILWFLYPKSKEFVKLFSKTFTSEQNAMLQRLPSASISEGIMHMYNTDKAALTKAKFDSSVLQDTNVANAIMNVAFKTHKNLADALPFKGLTMKQLFSSNAAVKANNIDFDQSKLERLVAKTENAGNLIQTVDKLTQKLIDKFTSPKMQFTKAKEKFDPAPYMSHLHSVSVEVSHVYNLTNGKEPDIKLLPYYIPIAFHGTSTLSATLISIFGFTTKWRKVGRSMGDGVYFAPNIDKSAQYLSTSGFSRNKATGIIFLARLYLPSLLKDSAASSKTSAMKTMNFQGKKAVAFTSRFRTQEACVFSSLIPYVMLEKSLVCSPVNTTGKQPPAKRAATTFKVVKRKEEKAKK
jgi:hypothetical protein